MNSNRALAAIGLVLAILLGSGLLLNRFLQPTAAISAPLDPACDLGRAACRSAVAGGSVEFDITPRPIQTMKQLTLAVTAEGIAADRVEVDFAGVEMNMGYNRFVLAQGAPGRFTGTAILPVCVFDRMTWEATVLLEGRGGARMSVPYRFETRRGG